MVGNLLFQSVLLRTRSFPLAVVLVGMTGTILFNLPPISIIVLSGGGVLWGIGAIGLAISLWNTTSVDTVPGNNEASR